jgi:hypothetical protein
MGRDGICRDRSGPIDLPIGSLSRLPRSTRNPSPSLGVSMFGKRRTSAVTPPAARDRIEPAEPFPIPETLQAFEQRLLANAKAIPAPTLDKETLFHRAGYRQGYQEGYQRCDDRQRRRVNRWRGVAIATAAACVMVVVAPWLLAARRGAAQRPAQRPAPWASIATQPDRPIALKPLDLHLMGRKPIPPSTLPPVPFPTARELFVALQEDRW